MAYGFKVFNEDGFIQADDTYSNYVVSQTGSTTIAVNATATLSFTNYGFCPLLFLRITGTTNRVTVETITATGATLRAPATNGSTVTVEWYTAVPAVELAAPTGTFGLVVKNSAGGITFDSRRRYPRVQGIVAFTTTTTESAKTVPAMPDGTKPYFLASTLAGVNGNVQVATNQFMLLFVTVRQASNTSITVQLVQYGPYAGNVGGGVSFAQSKQLVVAMAPPA